MKRNIFIAFAIFLLSLILTDLVMAAYYIDIDVTESNGTDYDVLAMNVSMDIDYLADNGFINGDGLDIRLKTSSGSSLPFMPVEDKLMFASAIGGDKTTGFQLITGNTLLDSFPVIVGDGGYVTISDHTNLELGDDFELEWDGYINTDESDYLISKTDSFDVSTDGAGHVDVNVYGDTDVSQTTTDANDNMASDLITRVGQRIDDVPVSYINKVSFSFQKNGAPTGTGYARVRRVADDGIVGTLGSIDVSTISTGFRDFDSTPVYNPNEQDLYFTFEYAGSANPVYVKAFYDNANDTIAGYRFYYDGSYHTDATDDYAIKIYWGDITVQATVTAGEHKITVTGDGTDLKIYEDDVEEDSTAVISAADNANDLILGKDAIPYYDYYTHTTSDTLRITYQPDDIISGTTLINETNPGTHDGTITWGSNPAGITISTSGLLLDESYYYTGGESGTTDIFDPEPAELAPGLDNDKLDHNPLKPGVEGFAEASNGAFTESLVWYGGAWFILIAVGIALIILVREHLAFAGTVCFGLAIMFYVMGIFDYWVLIIFGIFFGATLIHERMPTW